MATTITLTEEAQAFFERSNDPALRDLVDLGVKEYGEFMGGLPIDVDVFQEDDSSRSKVYVSVVANSKHDSLKNRHHDFMNEWRVRHSGEELRAVGFSYHRV